MSVSSNVVLMAGGGGTRLWPLSRKGTPKQFLDLGSGKTLIEHTYERARAVAEGPENIFVATSRDYVDRVRQLLPDIAPDHIFIESERRDTAPAFAAVAVQLELLGRAEEPTIFMWSDHVFTAEEAFVRDLRRIPQLVAVNPDTVVIMGHRPTFAETGFGYIETGEEVAGEAGVYRVRAFKEKPDKETAEGYVAAGDYYWNMAYVSCRPSYLLAELQKYESQLMQGIEKFKEALAAHDEAGAAAAYAALPKQSIDYALLERTPNILVVTGDYGWNDVGNWAAVQEVFGIKGDHMPHGYHVHVDAEGNYVYNATDRAVSLLGVRNTIAVVTDDAVLIADRGSAARVKEVVERLEKEGRHELL